MYQGEMTHENISAIFDGAGDFIARELRCEEYVLYTYAIDGLTSGSDMSDYVLKPITEHLTGKTMEDIYHWALRGSIY